MAHQFGGTAMVKVASIVAATSQHYGIPKGVLFSTRRDWNILRPRQVCMYLSRAMTNRSFPEIGRDLGQDGRVYDHTTVLHAYRRVARLCLDDKKMRADVAAIRRLARASSLGTTPEFVSPERTA